MSLYGGIYVSEFIMRMSTIPQMKYVGNFQLCNENGIYFTNANRKAVVDAANGGYITNTQNLSFGFYLSAQVTAEAVAYWAINRSTALYATTLGTNGPTVPDTPNYNATMPAVYAQAYQGDNGKRYVVFTNKGSNAVPVQVMEDGVALTNQFLETFVTGSDPSATNSAPEHHPCGDPIPDGHQPGHDPRLQRGPPRMDGLQCAAACARVGRDQSGANLELGGFDERDL